MNREIRKLVDELRDKYGNDKRAFEKALSGVGVPFTSDVNEFPAFREKYGAANVGSCLCEDGAEVYYLYWDDASRGLSELRPRAGAPFQRRTSPRPR